MQDCVKHIHRFELGENAFWLALWSVVGVFVVALSFVVAWYNLREIEAIAKTPAPLETACAISGRSTIHPACLTIANSGHV